MPKTTRRSRTVGSPELGIAEWSEELGRWVSEHETDPTPAALPIDGHRGACAAVETQADKEGELQASLPVVHFSTPTAEPTGQVVEFRPAGPMVEFQVPDQVQADQPPILAWHPAVAARSTALEGAFERLRPMATRLWSSLTPVRRRIVGTQGGELPVAHPRVTLSPSSPPPQRLAFGQNRPNAPLTMCPDLGENAPLAMCSGLGEPEAKIIESCEKCGHGPCHLRLCGGNCGKNTDGP